MPNLQRLKLECEDYGPCPVTQLPGYKNYVLQCVQNKGLLMQLDCEQLSEQDYSQAQDAYMEQIMSLQESLQAVESQHRHALL